MRLSILILSLPLLGCPLSACGGAASHTVTTSATASTPSHPHEPETEHQCACNHPASPHPQKTGADQQPARTIPQTSKKNQHHHSATSTPHDEQQNANRLGKVIQHAQLRSYQNSGNTLTGIATRTHGAKEFEVWRTSIAVGSRTPTHTHATEEIFVILRGRGRAHIGGEIIEFKAPATLIAPADVPHFVENTGNIPTDSIVIVGSGSTIRNERGQEMSLPWRK